MTGIVLLTGATGFVGRQVLLALLERGIRVRVVVRSGKQNQFAKLRGIEGVVSTRDLFAESAEWWVDVCKNIDTVIHVAWYAEPGKYLQSANNLDCLKWLPQQQVEFAWCRLFYLYGEGEDTRRLVPYLRSKLESGESAELTSGNQVRDFLDVRDAGQTIVTMALSNKEGPINICSGIPITVRQLAEKIADEYGRRDLLKFGMRQDNLVEPLSVVGVNTAMEN